MTRLLGIFAAAIVALGLTAPKAEAVVIYDWTGTCDSGCTGQASAVLTLADSYTPGTEVMDSDFIAFSYSSSSGAFDIPDDAALRRFQNSPVFLPAVSGPARIEMNFTGAGTFAAFFSPNWIILFTPSGISEDRGVDPVWTLRQPTELSAPGSLSLLALGLAGLALAGRRRKQG